MIDVTDAPLEALVRAAYNPSRPQGLGHFDYQPGDLTDAEVAAIVERGKGDRMCAISMDYVKGRSCKFNVKNINGRRYIWNDWYDHNDRQLAALLRSVGIDGEAAIAAARKEYADAQQAATDAALKLFGERGGTIAIAGYDDEDKLSEDVSWGLTTLTYGSPPRARCEFGKNGAKTYTLI